MTEPLEPPFPEDETVEPTEPVEAAGGIDPAEPVEAVEAVESIEVVSVAGAVEAVEVVETVEAVEAVGDVEDGEDDEVDEDAEDDAHDDIGSLPPPAAQAVTGAPKPAPGKAPRPDLIDRRDPLYRECKGYRLRLDPPDLARLRELPGSRGKSDDEIGEAFFDGQAERLASAIADDVPTPSEIRVVVDPYSRQAFLALENRIRGILSF